MYQRGDFSRFEADVKALADGADTVGAVDLVARRWPQFSSIEGTRLRALIQRLPSAAWQHNPWMLAALGASYRSVGSPSRSAALPYFRTADSLTDERLPLAPRAGIHLHSAAALRSLGKIDAALDRATAARNLLDGDGELPPSLRVRLQAKVSLQLGIIRLHRGDYAAAAVDLRLAAGLQDDALLSAELVECYGALAFVRYTAGEFSAAAGLVELAREAAESEELFFSAFGAPALITQLMLAVEQNRPADAAALDAPVASAALRTDWHPLALYARGTVSIITGRHIEGLELMRESLASTAGWEGSPAVRVIAEGMRGVLFMHLGELREAESIFAKITPTENHANCPARFLAGIRFAEGDAAGCLAAMTSCVELGEHHSTRTIVDMLLLSAAANYELGNLVSADIQFDRGMLAASRNGMRTPFLVVPAVTMQRMLGRAANRSQPDDVDAMLGDLRGGYGGPLLGTREPLSHRELDIARHLVLEKTIDQIARELYISANTVKTHLRSIYRKLGAANRRDAARRMHELGMHREITPFSPALPVAEKV